MLWEDSVVIHVAKTGYLKYYITYILQTIYRSSNICLVSRLVGIHNQISKDTTECAEMNERIFLRRCKDGSEC